MQKTSELYQQLLATDYLTETRLAIGETGVLITKQGDRITFGSKSYTAEAKGSVIQLENVPEAPLRGLTIYGKTTQNGTPSPDNPVPLVSPGDSGILNVYVGDQVIPISTPNGLPGIPVTSGGNYTDETGQQWVCDYVDFGRGVRVQRIGKKILDGTESWEVNKNYHATVYTKIVEMKNKSSLMCNRYKYISRLDGLNDADSAISSGEYMNFKDSKYAVDDSTWRAHLAELYTAGNPLTVVYELKTPAETPLSESELSAYAALHTSYPNTTIYNDGGADMVIGYALNGEGPANILVGATGADGGYDESLLVSIETKAKLFPDKNPTVGHCVAGQINIEMHKPFGEIPENARLVPYVRLVNRSKTLVSEWIQKGVFRIDTRKKKEDGSTIEKIVIRGYDDMMRMEDDYPDSKLKWPAKDIDVVREIAESVGIAVDDRTEAVMQHGYLVQYPGEYSKREVLGYIASMYAGCFIITEIGDLRLVPINSIPPETRYLITKDGFAITFGGVRIVV